MASRHQAFANITIRLPELREEFSYLNGAEPTLRTGFAEGDAQYSFLFAYTFSNNPAITILVRRFDPP